MTEEWKTIDGAEHYEVSNLGRVRRSLGAPKTVNTYNGKILRPDCATGYDRVTLRMGRKLIRALIHRLVARAFLPEARKFAHVNHIDGIKTNNRVDNLEWCSPQHNVQHAWKLGLCTPNQGEKHGMSKLKDGDVIRIREARERGVSLATLAESFNVTETTISMIERRIIWKHLCPT